MSALAPAANDGWARSIRVFNHAVWSYARRVKKSVTLGQQELLVE